MIASIIASELIGYTYIYYTISGFNGFELCVILYSDYSDYWDFCTFDKF